MDQKARGGGETAEAGGKEWIRRGLWREKVDGAELNLCVNEYRAREAMHEEEEEEAR